MTVIAVIYCCLNTSLAAFGSYLPVILEAQGRTPLHTQLLTIPVYVCTAAAILLLGYASDRTKQRGIMLMGSFAVAAAGWLMLILSSSKNLSFGATFLIGIGTYPTVMLTQAWMNSNIIGFTKRYVLFIIGRSVHALNQKQSRRFGHDQYVRPMSVYCWLRGLQKTPSLLWWRRFFFRDDGFGLLYFRCQLYLPAQAKRN